jgi:hypothetical protein
MWTNVISIALFIGGVVCYAFAKQLGFETNPFFYGKVLLAIAGGGGVTLYNNLGLLKSLPTLSMNTKVAPENSKIFVPEAYEIKDFEAITHLRDRCVQASSDEGIKICAQLASVLFQLDTPKKG